VDTVHGPCEIILKPRLNTGLTSQQKERFRANGRLLPRQDPLHGPPLVREMSHQDITKFKERGEFVNHIDFAELGKIKPQNGAASAKRLSMAPIGAQQAYMQQALHLIEILGGRVEILKVDASEDNIISLRNFDVKYMGDRPSIGHMKQLIEHTTNHEKRQKLREKFAKRATYTQLEYSQCIL